MSVVKTVSLKDGQGQKTTYDIGALAQNVVYSSSNNTTVTVKDKIDNYEEVMPSSATSSNKLATANDIPDVSNFITKAVNDLTYYYTSSNTYTKTEVDNLIAAAKNGRFIVVSSLPTTDIDTKAIYLLPKSTAQTNNVYDEYVNTDGTSAGQEKIGDTEIDLSNYVQKSNTTGLIKNDGTIDTNTYALSSALADYIAKSNTSGLVKNDGTIDTTTYISDISGKADKVTSATNGDIATLDSNGNLVDGGILATNLVTKSSTSGLIKNDGTIDTTTYVSDISGKTDKVTSATSGNLAGLNASGNLTDSGYAITASTTDLEDGVSQLTTGTIYLVYET